MENFYVVSTGNEFGEMPLDQSNVHLSIEDALIDYYQKIEEESCEVITVYEFDVIKMKFEQIELYILDE